MKTFLSAIISLMTIVTVYAQCDAPIVESWSVSETVNYSVNFTPPEGALTYELIISADYGNLIPSEPLILTGNISSGINTINFDVTGLLENTTYYARYYFTAKLSVTCANGSESGINRFYVSALSLLNDPAINVGDFFFKPLTFLPDGSGFSYDSYLSIPAAEASVEIEDISVFIDLGHTYNGDLSIELISPQGISVYLLFPANGLAGNKGFSVIFQDGMPTIGNEGTGSTRGLFSPYQPLSAFTGINPEGVWIVRVTDNYAIDDGMLFGVSLIINSSPCESSIHGKAYYDLNSNAIQDENEPGFGNAVISNSSGSETIFASSTGQFTKCLQAGSGVLSISNPPLYYSFADIPYSINTGDVLDNLDFSLTPQPGIKDLKIELFASTPNRPGFSSNYLVHYQNIGTECVDNVAIDIDLDALLLITASGNPNVSFSGNIASLNIPQICPLESGMFSITTYLNDTVSIGTLLESTAQISPTEGDENSSDNVST